MTVTFYGRALARAAPDFTLIGLPDTQYYTGQVNGGRNAMFKAQTHWIVANRAARNIVYVGPARRLRRERRQRRQRHRVAARRRVARDSSRTRSRPGCPTASPTASASATTTSRRAAIRTARRRSTTSSSARPASPAAPTTAATSATTTTTHYDLFSASGMDFIVDLLRVRHDARRRRARAGRTACSQSTPTGARSWPATGSSTRATPASFGAQGRPSTTPCRGIRTCS